MVRICVYSGSTFGASPEYATVAAEQTALENLADIVADQITARVALYAARTAPAR